MVKISSGFQVLSPALTQLSFSFHSHCLMYVLCVFLILRGNSFFLPFRAYGVILQNCLCSEPTAYKSRWRNRVVAKFVALWQWLNTSVKCDVSNVLSSSPVSYWYLRRNFHQWSLFSFEQNIWKVVAPDCVLWNSFVKSVDQ